MTSLLLSALFVGTVCVCVGVCVRVYGQKCVCVRMQMCVSVYGSIIVLDCLLKAQLLRFFSVFFFFFIV